MEDKLDLGQPEKQEENRIVNNPEGKGGFQDHPELINKSGRPPKGSAWSEVLEEIGETVDPKSNKTYKELVGLRIWQLCMSGNVSAIRELFNRMEGLPRIKLEHSGKVDTGLHELVERVDKIFGLDDDKEIQPETTGDNQGNS